MSKSVSSDHIGPIDGMCFLGLNFTEEQFCAMQETITDHMVGKPEEFAVEGAFASIVKELAASQLEVARLRGVIEDALAKLDPFAVKSLKEFEVLRGVQKALRAALQPVENQGGGE